MMLVKVLLLYCLLSIGIGLGDINDPIDTINTNQKFVKINFPLPSTIAYEGKRKLSVSRSVPEHLFTPTLRMLREKYGNCAVDYLDVSMADQLRVLEILPKDLLKIEVPRIEWQVISADRMVIPHIDSNRQSALNFYLQVNDEETVFYENATNEYFVELTQNRIFDEEWVSPQSSFVAHNHDTYLIDVSTIHSVKGLPEQRIDGRVSLSCGFHLPFDVVLRYFKDRVA